MGIFRGDYEYRRRTFERIDAQQDKVNKQEEDIRELIKKNAELATELKHTKRNSFIARLFSIGAILLTGIGINLLSDPNTTNNEFGLVFFIIGAIVEIIMFLLVK